MQPPVPAADAPPLGAGIDFADPNSPLAPYYLSASQVVYAAALAAVYLLANYAALWHTDVWGHLKFGQWFLTHGWPTAEPFTPFGDPSTNLAGYCWLGQVLFAATFNAGTWLAGGDFAGGVDALRFLHAVLVTGRVALLSLAVQRASRSWPLAAMAAVMLPLLFLGNVGVARPQVVAELLFAVLVYVAAAPGWVRSNWWVVPGIMVVWANAHGSYPIGVIFITTITTGIALDRAQHGARSVTTVITDTTVTKWLSVCGLSAIGVLFLTPAGPRILLNTWTMANHPNIRFMDEWQPLDFVSTNGGHWVYLLTVTFVAVTYMLSPTPYPWGKALLVLAFGLQPLKHQRAIVWWLALVPVLTLPYWPAIATHFRWPTWPASVPSFRKTLLAAAVAVLAVLWSIPSQWLLDGRPAPLARTLSAGTPHQIVEVIRGNAKSPEWTRATARYPEGRFRGRVFASETLGDYFVWHDLPGVDVYIYSHVHLFPADHWRRVQTIRAAGKGWSGLLDDAKVNLVVVEAEQNRQLCDKLKGDRAWTVVLDETGRRDKWDKKCRLFAAVRSAP